MIPKDMIEAAESACHGKVPRVLIEHILTAALSSSPVPGEIEELLQEATEVIVWEQGLNASADGAVDVMTRMSDALERMAREVAGLKLEIDWHIEHYRRLETLLAGQHKSGCATNNAPAYPPGECDCGLEKKEGEG